jgi:hypothetical protein
VVQALCPELSEAFNWAYTVSIKGNNSLGSDDSKETVTEVNRDIQPYLLTRIKSEITV